MEHTEDAGASKNVSFKVCKKIEDKNILLVPVVIICYNDLLNIGALKVCNIKCFKEKLERI